MNNVPFYVNVALSSPVILSDSYLTLDAILGAAIFKRTADPEQAINGIPLKRTDGIYHGSQAYLETVGSGEFGSVRFVRKLGGADGEPGAWVPNNPKIKNGYSVLTAKGDYGNKMDSREFMLSKNMLWFGCGDVDAVRDLLTEITSVGAKRNQGFGQVEIDQSSNEFAWTVTECPNDCSLIAAGRPARPIPLDDWRNHMKGGDDVATAMVTVTLPAWQPNPTLCAVPDARIVQRLSVLLKAAVAAR